RYFTEDDDGLAHDWHGRVWLNPPYGRIAGDFIDHLVKQYDTGNVTAAVALVNAHTTDTAWFQQLWDHTLCFTDHRIDFAAGTEKRSGSTHGSVFAYLGPLPRAFADVFAAHGAVVRRWPA
ncbi:MAG: DNA N-6-adenine-methyltransferase, partial [Acidimicrobiales bacterium]